MYLEAARDLLWVSEEVASAPCHWFFWQLAPLMTQHEIQFWFLSWEDPLEEENGHPLQYSCLKNPIDREAWQAIQSMGSYRVGQDLVSQNSCKGSWMKALLWLPGGPVVKSPCFHCRGMGWIPHSTWLSVFPPTLIITQFFYFCISRCS